MIATMPERHYYADATITIAITRATRRYVDMLRPCSATHFAIRPALTLLPICEYSPAHMLILLRRWRLYRMIVAATPYVVAAVV